MNCYRCGGELERTTVNFCACNATPPLFVDHVPAQVCVSCGERIYANETVQVLERIRDGLVFGARPKLVVGYDYREALRGINSPRGVDLSPIEARIVTYSGGTVTATAIGTTQPATVGQRPELVRVS